MKSDCMRREDSLKSLQDSFHAASLCKVTFVPALAMFVSLVRHEATAANSLGIFFHLLHAFACSTSFLGFPLRPLLPSLFLFCPPSIPGAASVVNDVFDASHGTFVDSRLPNRPCGFLDASSRSIHTRSERFHHRRLPCPCCSLSKSLSSGPKR